MIYNFPIKVNLIINIIQSAIVILQYLNIAKTLLYSSLGKNIPSNLGIYNILLYYYLMTNNFYRRRLFPLNFTFRYHLYKKLILAVFNDSLFSTIILFFIHKLRIHPAIMENVLLCYTSVFTKIFRGHSYKHFFHCTFHPYVHRKCFEPMKPIQ